MEHPEDRKNRVIAEFRVVEHGEKLLKPKMDELKELIFVYDSQEAIERLEALRDWFWGEVL